MTTSKYLVLSKRVLLQLYLHFKNNFILHILLIATLVALWYNWNIATATLVVDLQFNKKIIRSYSYDEDALLVWLCTKRSRIFETTL